VCVRGAGLRGSRSRRGGENLFFFFFFPFLSLPPSMPLFSPLERCGHSHNEEAMQPSFSSPPPLFFWSSVMPAMASGQAHLPGRGAAFSSFFFRWEGFGLEAPALHGQKERFFFFHRSRSKDLPVLPPLFLPSLFFSLPRGSQIVKQT